MQESIKDLAIPDIVHVHNTFPLWTYSVLDFFKKKNVPIIMTLHNYRLIWEKLGLFKKDREKYGYFQRFKYWIFYYF